MPTPITLHNIYPWGRSFDEYQRMFALSEIDLQSKILDVASGPASFNAEMHRRNKRVISCDPLYQFSSNEIRTRVAQTAQEMIRKAKENSHRFVWQRIKSPEEMANLRLAAMEKFLEDYDQGKSHGRYITAALPHLPFADRQFDLSLCSHFLFLYDHERTLELHLAAIAEMSRVANETRIFPLLNMAGKRSAYVDSLAKQFHEHDFKVSIETVDYEFQRGGNQMMRIKTAS